MFFLVIGCSLLEEMRIKIRGEAYQSLLQGQRLLAEGDYEAALLENEKVISLSSTGPLADQALFNIGMIHVHPGNPKKDHAKSVLFFKKLAEEYPRNPLAEEARVWIVMIQEHDRLNQVIRTLGQKVEQLNKERESVRALYSEKLLAPGDVERAVRENQKIISSSPPSPHVDQALFNMGLIYAHPGSHKKDYGKSVAFFQKLIKDHPQSPRLEEAKVLIGMLQENDKLIRAVERLTLAIEDSKKTVERLNRVIEESRKVDVQIEEKRREKGK